MPEPLSSGPEPDVHGAPAVSDAWGRFRERFRRRRGARAALGVLALFYAGAIFAPLLATDRPLLVDAADVGAYERARTSLPAVARGLAERIDSCAAAVPLAPGAPAAPAANGRRPDPEGRAALEAERRALGLRLATMRRYLPPGKQAALDALEGAAGEATRAALAGRWAEARAASAAAIERALTARRELAARTSSADGPTVDLVPRRSYPALEAIGPLGAGLMGLWVALCAWSVWSRPFERLLSCLRSSRSRGRRHRGAQLACALAFAGAFGLAWARVFPAEPGLAPTPFKLALGGGATPTGRAIFAPISYGFAETHMREIFRPPTWRADSELDREGRYVRGARAGRGPAADTAAGQAAEPVEVPVEVRRGEPALNAPTRHLFGTDSLGRDVLARLFWGARISLSVGLLSALLLVSIGLVLGALAGYVGGKLDFAIARVIEVFQSFPAFFLILTAVALVPEQRLHPMLAVITVIALVGWTGVARLVRAEILRVRELDYVLAARALGLGAPRILVRHVLPNALGPVLVAGAFAVASGILIESAVSFLGFGVRLPVPSWGALINDSRVPDHWWIQVFPGLLIFLTVVCYNLVGEGLRDALDPRAPA